MNYLTLRENTERYSESQKAKPTAETRLQSLLYSSCTAWLYTILQFSNLTVYASDGVKDAYTCIDSTLADTTVDYFMGHPDTKFICIGRALDSTKKFNLKNRMQDKFFAF